MAHKYDSIRELDKEVTGRSRLREPEMSIIGYMIPPPFEAPFAPIEMDHIRNIMITSTKGVNSSNRTRFVKVANSSNRIRVKNVHTNVSIEFEKMIDAARFVGTTGNNMRCGIAYEEAKVYIVGGEEYVFVYDDKERPTQGFSTGRSLTNSLVEVVSSKGERYPFSTYLSVAKCLGLLIGHVMEEEKRAGNGELAKMYILGKEAYTIEFGRKERQKCFGRGIRCFWKGIYDEDGDWEKISRIKVTRPSHEPI